MESCNTESSLDLPLESLSLQSFLQSLHKEQWQEVRLGEVAKQIVSGGTPKSTQAEYYNGNIPWLNTKEVKNCRIYATERQITELGLCNSSAKWIDKNSVIVAMYGATAGKVAINKIPLTTNQACCNISVDSEKANYNFIYYTLLDSFDRLDQMTSGAAQQNLNVGLISNFTFLLPPLTIQQKIAEILSSFDDKIDLLHRQNKTLESLALTLFRHYFIDNPKRDEWELGKLGEEFDFVMGVSPKGSSYNEQQRGVPMFQGNADFGFRFPTNRIYTDEPRKFAEKFDTLVSVRAPVGAVNIAQEKCCIGRGLSAFRHKHKDLHSYTFYKMKFLSKEFERFNDKGTIFGAISKGDFENIDIWIPPLEYGVRINQELKIIDDKIYNNSKQIENLQAMRDMLLKAIFE
ncbi:restriction modification system DNA specificity domain protein [Helicobacter cinaedi]|uniref:Restriction modification system DNA specificity domain protein n=1 Tax=Helicobacter cinaedi TaxID=213 RepID=A0A377JV07_9HELI|nr:restriction endonuclease subunit S [Helicobacter cinaedi]STP11800.1 restriction modification system DNA specificity domain protein [Helicobacter cinaedi]